MALFGFLRDTPHSRATPAWPAQQVVSSVQFDRYDIDQMPAPAVLSDVAGFRGQLNYGPQPFLIPRIWNMGLGGRAGLDQWGFPGVNNNWLALPPPPIYPPRRADTRSISLMQSRRSADTIAVPSTFIGWTPNTGGLNQ